MDPEAYLADLPEPRRGELRRLDALIRETLPDLEQHVESGMLAYGRYAYRYASGREGEWFRIGLASRKTGISLYVVAVTPDGGYLAEARAAEFPKASVGKSCIRFKRFTDIDFDALRSLLEEAGRLQPAGAA